MKKILSILCCCICLFQAKAGDSITGRWRGSIIGHTDNKDYFIRAKIDSFGVARYKMRMKITAAGYTGEFWVYNTLQQGNKLYIDSLQRISEFPKALPHLLDCFSGYFLLKTDSLDQRELDLYRNPVYHRTEDFTLKDSSGDLMPDFECFTSVLLHPEGEDTVYMEREKQLDSMVSVQAKSQELNKRKIVSSKEWTVKKPQITLQVWDNNKEDGDSISLKFNDTWILTNFLLKKEKFTIHLTLTQKDNQLLLFAENLGSIPPNTAAISIDDDELVRTFILNSDMSKSESVKIILLK